MREQKNDAVGQIVIYPSIRRLMCFSPTITHMDDPGTSQSSLSSATLADKNNLVPTTDLIAEDCPR